MVIGPEGARRCSKRNMRSAVRRGRIPNLPLSPYNNSWCRHSQILAQCCHPSSLRGSLWTISRRNRCSNRHIHQRHLNPPRPSTQPYSRRYIQLRRLLPPGLDSQKKHSMDKNSRRARRHSKPQLNSPRLRPIRLRISQRNHTLHQPRHRNLSNHNGSWAEMARMEKLWHSFTGRPRRRKHNNWRRSLGVQPTLHPTKSRRRRISTTSVDNINISHMDLCHRNTIPNNARPTHIEDML